jgi:hypothetical protein
LKKKFFIGCVFISTVLFLGSASLYLYAEIADPQPIVSNQKISYPHVSVGDIGISATKSRGGNLLIFNGAFPNLNLLGKDIKNTDANWLLFHSRVLIGPNIHLWTIWFSLWSPIILFSILPLAFFIKKCSQAKRSGAN